MRPILSAIICTLLLLLTVFLSSCSYINRNWMGDHAGKTDTIEKQGTINPESPDGNGSSYSGAQRAIMKNLPKPRIRKLKTSSAKTGGVPNVAQASKSNQRAEVAAKPRTKTTPLQTKVPGLRNPARRGGGGSPFSRLRKAQQRANQNDESEDWD